MTTLTTIEEVAATVTDAAARVTEPSRLTGQRPAAAASVLRRAIVGIVGAPGSGKTTIGTLLTAQLGPAAQLLSMDGFHLPQRTLVELGRRHRMGAPDTFDVDGFVDLLQRARDSDDAILAPGFDREIEESTPGTVQIAADTRILVVEGNYLLLDFGGWERVAPLVDLSFVVHIDPDLRLTRLIERHERFGKSPADARAWAGGPDAANAELIEASAHRANHEIRLA